MYLWANAAMFAPAGGGGGGGARTGPEEGVRGGGHARRLRSRGRRGRGFRTRRGRGAPDDVEVRVDLPRLHADADEADDIVLARRWRFLPGRGRSGTSVFASRLARVRRGSRGAARRPGRRGGRFPRRRGRDDGAPPSDAVDGSVAPGDDPRAEQAGRAADEARGGAVLLPTVAGLERDARLTSRRRRRATTKPAGREATTGRRARRVAF